MYKVVHVIYGKKNTFWEYIADFDRAVLGIKKGREAGKILAVRTV